jgi:hypothetical protein
MNNVIITAEDAYNKFLIDVRRWYTGQVTPDMFSWFWNDAQLESIKSKLPLIEFNQKRIDDIEILRCITDGSSIGFPFIASSDTNIFPLPSKLIAQDSKGQMYATISGENYPLYLHGLLASFVDGNGIVKPAWILRSDQKAISFVNPYRMPSPTRLLYEHVNGHIRMLGIPSSQMRLEYYRYPKLMKYDEDTPANSIDPEFNPSMNQEITDVAVKSFLENRQNPRYKSQLQEFMLKAQHN